MDIKKEIETLLESLKSVGKDRGTIEKELNYSENYIDQTLSRGGNKKVLGALKLYAQNILQNTTYNLSDPNPPIVNEPHVEYNINKKWGIDRDEVISALLEEKDRAIKKAEEHYEDAKTDKERLFKALDKLQESFDKTLKEISENLKIASINLKSNHDALMAIGRTVRSNDAEIMEALDHLEGNPVGTRQSKSHKVQKALREGVEAGAADKKTGTGRIGKDVKD